MPEQISDRDVLLSLAEDLPRELLLTLFPGSEPDSIRDILRRLAGRGKPTPVKPAAEEPAPSPANATPSLNQAANNCKLYTDGASRGNPGEAGAGVVLFDARGRELANRSVYLGRCTNNVAEYQALITGLELGLHHGCTTLQIFLDSELIVRQVTGQYKVKHPQLQPLFAKVRNLLDRFADWQIRHVPRAENARADELANLGIDRHSKKIGVGA